MVRRYRPQDFQVRPPRRYSFLPLFLLLIGLGGGVGWWQWGSRVMGKRIPYELVLKSVDKAVALRTLAAWTILDEGSPLEPGSTIQTRHSKKVILSLGPASSCRPATETELTYKEGGLVDKKAFASLVLSKGRLWLVQGPDVRWAVATPLATVRMEGKVAEVQVAADGSTTVRSWVGNCQMVPAGHEERSVSIGPHEEASFNAEKTLVNPHPLALTRDDPFLAWNLRETMGKTVQEKVVPPRTPQK